ncbi:hypothetical protein BHECKSOX2_813 [Bathymodiolus heckerae thiotrophic gill symbiont]|nr:hypothetical protein BHECKSOX2_813 [Bathymodiolus heckerae thiotrophic gill symbiont]
MFNESMHAGSNSKKSMPITDYQRKLSQQKTPMARITFWHVRNSQGDPFASTALDVVANRGIRGISANILSPINNEQLGINLMQDYISWIDRDYANINTNNRRGVLSIDQINSWHNNTFDRTPWSGFYGGNLPFTNDIICNGCDSYNLQ